MCNGDSSSKASIALFSAEYVEDIEGFRSRSFPFQGSNIFEDSKDFIKPVFLKRKKSIDKLVKLKLSFDRNILASLMK